MANEEYREELEELSATSRGRRRDYFVLPAWAWPIIGLVCVLAGLLLGWALFRPRNGEATPPAETPIPTSAVALKPTFTSVPPTATFLPPTATALPTSAPDTPTPTLSPTVTETPEPTATPTVALVIQVGGQAQVVGTGRDKLRLRSGPGRDFVTFKMVEDGTILQVIGGPTEADDFTWWRLKDNLDVVGWAADEWLQAVP